MAGPADAGTAWRVAGRIDVRHGADRGRRIEAGDDRRNPDALALRLPGCLWILSRRPSRGAAAGFWVLLSLAILTKGPIGPALIARVNAVELVVGLAGPSSGAASLAMGAGGTPHPDMPVVYRRQHRLAWRVPPLCRREADRPPARDRYGGPRRFSRVLPRGLDARLLSLVNALARGDRRGLVASQGRS